MKCLTQCLALSRPSVLLGPCPFPAFPGSRLMLNLICSPWDSARWHSVFTLARSKSSAAKLSPTPSFAAASSLFFFVLSLGFLCYFLISVFSFHLKIARLWFRIRNVEIRQRHAAISCECFPRMFLKECLLNPLDIIVPYYLG